jgi:hypothetical protein
MILGFENKCDKEFDHPNYNYLINIMVSDGWSHKFNNGSLSIIWIKEEAKTILNGLAAENFKKMLIESKNSKDLIREVIKNSKFTYFKILVKTLSDSKNEELCKKYYALDIIKESWKNHNKFLISKLNSYLE